MKASVTYYGNRDDDGRVTVTFRVGDHREPLPLRLDLRNHSPTGFEWGYGGSGPSQLALAILAHHCGGNEKRALDNYQCFKWKVISGLRGNDWRMTSTDIENVLRQCEGG